MVSEIAQNVKFWHSKGKGFLGRDDTPTGIHTLRKILGKWDPIDPIKYNVDTDKDKVQNFLHKLRDFGIKKIAEEKEGNAENRQGITNDFYTALANEDLQEMRRIAQVIKDSQPTKIANPPIGPNKKNL